MLITVDPRMTEGGDGNVAMEDVVCCLISDVQDLVDRGCPWTDAVRHFLAKRLIDQLMELATEDPVKFAAKGMKTVLRMVLDGEIKGRQVPDFLGQVPADGRWKDVRASPSGGVTFRGRRVPYNGLARGSTRPTNDELDGVRAAVGALEEDLGRRGTYRLFFHGTKSHYAPSVVRDVQVSMMAPHRQFGEGLATSDDAAVAADWAAFGARRDGVPCIVIFAVPVGGDGASEAEPGWGSAWQRLDTEDNHLHCAGPTDEWKRCIWAHGHDDRCHVRREFRQYGLISGPMAHNHARLMELDATADEVEPEWWPRNQGGVPAHQRTFATQYVFRTPIERTSGIGVLMMPETTKFVIVMGPERAGGDPAHYVRGRHIGPSANLRRRFDALRASPGRGARFGTPAQVAPASDSPSPTRQSSSRRRRRPRADDEGEGASQPGAKRGRRGGGPGR